MPSLDPLLIYVGLLKFVTLEAIAFCSNLLMSGLLDAQSSIILCVLGADSLLTILPFLVWFSV
jgi:hypothetical protein